ncbi:MAG: hypothetical protein IPH12_04615 [Saprospirales bacterium]|nr:hypothetical protein [Saprospirales bacterium]
MENILDQDFQRERTEAEQSELNLLLVDLRICMEKIRQGRIALYVMIGFTVLGTVLGLTSEIEWLFVFLEAAVVIGIYLFCIYSLAKNPLVSFIVALVTYLGMNILYGIIEPSNIAKGILVKAIIVYYLIQSITYSVRLRDYIRRGHNLGVEREDLLTMV